MKFAVLVLFCVIVGSVGAQAGYYIFVPSPADLGDLAHAYYYSWGINWSLPPGEEIVEAVLYIDSINNWRNEPNHLYIHLIDTPKIGVRQWVDNEGGGDNWLGAGPLLADYTDFDSSRPESLRYSLNDLGLLGTFKSYVANDGVFGFGFDPDCSYYNCGVKLKVWTTVIPEPTSMFAFVPMFAMLGFGIRRRLIG